MPPRKASKPATAPKPAKEAKRLAGPPEVRHAIVESEFAKLDLNLRRGVEIREEGRGRGV